MKARLLTIMALLIFTLIQYKVFAQRELTKRIEFDFGIGPSIMTGKYYNMKELDNYYSKTNFMFSSSINIPISYRGWGVWAEYTVESESNKYSRNPNLHRPHFIFPDYDVEKYYISQDYSYNNTFESFSVNIGGYRRFVYGNWALDARLGIGFSNPKPISDLGYSFTAKEKNANRIYYTYINDPNHDSEIAFILTGMINANYYIGYKQRFFVGCSLGYQQYFKRPQITFISTEEFSNEVVFEKTIKGNVPGYFRLAIRAGLSF